MLRQTVRMTLAPMPSKGPLHVLPQRMSHLHHTGSQFYGKSGCQSDLVLELIELMSIKTP